VASLAAQTKTVSTYDETKNCSLTSIHKLRAADLTHQCHGLLRRLLLIGASLLGSLFRVALAREHRLVAVATSHFVPLIPAQQHRQHTSLDKVNCAFSGLQKAEKPI
jgi:hypothetical protein